MFLFKLLNLTDCVNNKHPPKNAVTLLQVSREILTPLFSLELFAISCLIKTKIYQYFLLQDYNKPHTPHLIRVVDFTKVTLQ